jgi:hypothetical protein
LRLDAFRQACQPSNPTKETIGKKARKERRSRSGKREASLTLKQVVQTIEAIDENRQPIFWTLFFTQSRICEARGVLGQDYLFEAEDDWEKGRLFIERSADSNGAEAQIRNSTKNGMDGSYLMPEFIQKLIAKHCSHARFDTSLPLFRNPHQLAKSDIWTDGALADTSRAALNSKELPWVPLYKSMKHTQISALRDASVHRRLSFGQGRAGSGSSAQLNFAASAISLGVALASSLRGWPGWMHLAGHFFAALTSSAKLPAAASAMKACLLPS